MKQPLIKSTKLSINLRRFVCLSVSFSVRTIYFKAIDTVFTLFIAAVIGIWQKKWSIKSVSLDYLYFSPSLNFVRETEAHLSFVIRISPARVIIWEINAYHFAELRFNNCLPIVLSSKSLQLSSRN